ncbi:MAG TPA: PAS domain S-box protein [Nitrospirota bacterium]|nr:PAS domain S-box protein [Nitrospirota bacterium]
MNSHSHQGSEADELHASQVQQLFDSAPIGMVGTLLNAAVLSYIEWNVVERRVIVLWFAFLFLVTLIRGLHVYEYRHRTLSREELSDWGVWFTFGLAMSGIAWGSAAIFLFPAASTTHQVFLAFVLGGMVAGAAGTFSVRMSCFLAYSVPALLPLIIRFFLLGDEIHLAMGGLTVLYVLLIMSVALRVHSMSTTTLKLRFDNGNLVTHLASEKEEAERLNEELVFEIAERKNAEQELNNHRKHLEERVLMRTAELSDANVRLETEVAARTHAEESLRRSEEHFRSLIENALDLITVLDAAGKILFESPSLELLLGYRPADLVGRDVFGFIHPEDRTAAREALTRIMREPEATDSIELRVLHENGSWRKFQVNARSMADASGAMRVIINSRDITERKKLEEDIQRVQKLDSIGVLAGGLAHDFNNLITGIAVNIDLAKMKTAPGDERLAFLEKAEQASARAHELTQQLLTFSRGGDPVRKIVPVKDMVRESAAFALTGSPAACSFSIPDDIRPVEVDPGQVRQAIHNLVVNAEQAMPQGGTVRISCENIKLPQEIMPLKAGDYVKISIADDGVGIPKENFSRIFDPYFTTKRTGSGLGLATAYSIIRKHGGNITVESEPGAGSTFTLFLPASAKEATGGDIGLKLIRGTGRVLIMDDEEIVRDAAGKILQASGYETEFATEGNDAVELYRKAIDRGQRFDVVILDLTVPGGTGGRETMKRLLELDPAVRAIVSSGYSHDPIMANFRDYGFLGVIVKPYTVREMSEAVHNVMATSAERI